jgi:putative PEP-CTERM system histidine kinase
MFSYFAILQILSVPLCISLGVFILYRNPRHPTNIGFAIGMASLAIIEAGNALALISTNKVLLGIQISLVGQAILPSGWLLFSIVFARANYKEVLSQQASFLVALSIASIPFILWVGSPMFVSLSSEWSTFANKPSHFIIGPLGRYFYIYLIIGLSINLIHLENTLRSSSGSKRWKIKYVLFGVGAILAFFIYISSQALLFSTLKIEILPVVSFVILISSSMMAIFIIKNRLLDADIFISRYVIYNSFTILIVGFYLLSVGLIAQGIKHFNIPLSYFFTTLFVFVSILALVIILFFSSLRRKVQLFINRHFYKHKYAFRDKWMETTEKISSKESIEDVSKTLAEMITETMGARSVYIWLYEPIAGNYRAIENEMATSYKIITKDHPLIKHIKTKTDPFMINDLRHNGSEMQEDLESLVTETGAVLCAPFIAGDEIVGFILQGEDISIEPYRQEDFEYLKAVTTQAAVQIKTIELTRDLLAAKQAEAFHRLSSFIMHDLKNLTNSLFLVSQNTRYHMDNPEFQSDAIKTIDVTVSRMKGLIERLAGVSKGFQFKKRKVD